MEVSSPVAAAIISAVLGGGLSWIVTRATKKYDSTSAAAASEINVRAQFVGDLQKEVGQLRETLNAAWQREREAAEKHRTALTEADRLQREAFTKYQRDMDALDKRWRHLARELLTRDAYLRRVLSRNGIPADEIPEFKGLERFEQEGGSVPDDWERVLYGDPAEDPHLHEEVDVLVVDDNEQLGRRWKNVLEQEGYTCRNVKNGLEAFRVTETRWPKLILIDLILGDMDGVQLIGQMREAGYSGPAIAVTGGSKAFGDAAADKFAEVLWKPMLNKDLCEAVKRHLPKST